MTCTKFFTLKFDIYPTNVRSVTVHKYIKIYLINIDG